MAMAEHPKKEPKHKAHLSGIWATVGTKTVLDNTIQKDEAAPHGTFTDIPYYRIHMFSDTVFRIFDENGHFAHFALDPQTDRWLWKPDPWQVNVDAGDIYAPKGAKLTRYPTLVLTAYNDTDFPQPLGSTDKWCPRPKRNDNATAPTPSEQNTLQWVTLSRSIDKTVSKIDFYWKPNEQEEGLLFSQVFPHKASPDNTQKYGQVFVVQDKELSQWTFPFCGFDVRSLNLFAQIGPGTTWQADKVNADQGIGGRLLFKYPLSDSKDYWQQQDSPGQPNVPIGIRLVSVPYESGVSHSEMVSSAVDHLSSYSGAFGLKGSIDKILSTGSNVTCQKQVEDQQKHESRYTISRNITAKVAYITDITSLTLHGNFVDDIQKRLVEKLSEPKVRWENFVNEYGMHYAASIVEGWMEIAQTRFSMKSESQAVSQSTKVDLKAAATDVSGLLKFSGDASTEWKNTYQLDVSNDYVQKYTIGSNDLRVGILFDLRPLHQLLNPILLEYNPADTWQKMAPFVWYELRDSLSSYLDTMGFNTPIDPSLETEYTPRLVKVSFPKVYEYVDDRRWDSDHDWDLYAYGSIGFGDCDDNTRPQPKELESPDNEPVQYTMAKIGYQPKGDHITGDGLKLDENKLGLAIAVKRGQPVTFELDVNFNLLTGNESWMKPDTMQSATHNFKWAYSHVMKDKVDIYMLPYNEAEDAPGGVKSGASIYYQFWMQVRLEEVDWDSQLYQPQ